MSVIKSVIVFSQEYPPHNWGGVTPFTVNLVNGLSTFGIHVQLMTISKKEQLVEQENGVTIYRIPASGVYQDEFMDTEHGLRRHLQFLKISKRVVRGLRRPHAVILADGLCFPEAKGCALHFQVPLITMVNQVFSDINRLWEGKLTSMVQLEQRYFRESDCLVVGSQYMKLRMELLGYGHKTTYINYGWGFQNWTKEVMTLPKTDFVFIGRMVPEKGILNLLDAFQGLLKIRPHCTLKLIGDGPMKLVAEKRAEKYDLMSNVSFWSAVPWTQISQVFQSARCSVVVPSFNEPFGYVALEAIMYGAFPIVNNTGGLREIAAVASYECCVPGEEREPFICYPNTEKLTEKMVEFLDIGKSVGGELQQIARMKALETYNFLTTTAHWIKFLENL